MVVDDCEYEACGGDLADSDWSYTRICVEEAALLGRFEEACPTVELLSSSGEVSGSISFDADSYTEDVSLSVTGEFGVPASCNVLGCEFTSIVLGGVLSDVSCTDLDGGCVCSGTLEGTSTISDGAYTTDGDDIALDDVDATYCASGDSFKYTGVIEQVPFVYESVPQ